MVGEVGVAASAGQVAKPEEALLAQALFCRWRAASARLSFGVLSFSLLSFRFPSFLPFFQIRRWRGFSP